MIGVNSERQEAERPKVVWIAPPWMWRRRRAEIEGPLWLALLLWLCTLPLVLLLVVPFFGWTVGLTAATILLIAILLICLGICFPGDQRAR